MPDIIKKEYNIKDTVWIHMGEKKLTKGRIVEIIDFEHLNEGHSPDNEFYVIQVQTGIDPVYEVRDFGQISPDSQGPIALFRREGLVGANRFLRKVGLPIPQFEEWHDSTTTKTANTSTTVLPKNNKKHYYRKKKKSS
jgi:hypothetical protein